MHQSTTFFLPKKWHVLPTAYILCFFFTPSLSFSQDPYLQKSNAFIREEAVRITAKYQPGLVMGVDQALQFQEKVAEFLIRKNAVLDTDFSPGKKQFYLERLSAQETSEMSDILERYRMEEYIRLKKEIQPLPLLSEVRPDSLPYEGNYH